MKMFIITVLSVALITSKVTPQPLQQSVNGSTIKAGNIRNAVLPVTLIKGTNIADDIGRQIPVSIEVKLGSKLYSTPGTPASIMFAVTNNMPIPIDFGFSVSDNYNYVKKYFPNKASLTPGGIAVVEVELMAQGPTVVQGNNPDIVSLTVIWTDHSIGMTQNVIKRTYFFTDNQQTDSTKPSISYEYIGDCSGSLTPQTCNAKQWSVKLSVQDQVSGLLALRSEPVGLQLDNEFIVGDKNGVRGTYEASCCNTKVDIFAIDLIGNSVKTTIDIEKKWLSTGEITAIVLGCIIALILIIIAIYFIVSCVKRRNRILTIYPRHRPTNTTTD